MSVAGQIFAINGIGVEAPDDVNWTPISMGDSLEGTQRRSHYFSLEWSRRVDPGCPLTWFEWDNTILTSLTSPLQANAKESEVFTDDVICQSVKSVHHHGHMQGIRAVFLVLVP